MPKITFMGAGSTVFAKSILGDAHVHARSAGQPHRAVRH